MNMEKFLTVNPDNISNAIYLTLGEGFPHVDQFTDQNGYEWQTWCQDSTKMIPLIRAPLLVYWQKLEDAEKTQLKQTLQYLLNADEFSPYEKSTQFPGLKSKPNGLGEKYFASYQDTIQPYDWYELCLWLWEILFHEEDWHTDISNWVCDDKEPLYVQLQKNSNSHKPIQLPPRKLASLKATWEALKSIFQISKY